MEGKFEELKKVVFLPEYSKTKENFLLFEVSEDFLSQLKSETSFLIKNDPVRNYSLITTSNATFKLKKNEFSNTLYLCSKNSSLNYSNNSKDSLNILSQNQSIFAVNRMQPNKNNVYNHMKSHCLINENENLQENNGISKENAIKNLGISSKEFEEFAEELNFIENDGFYWILDEKLRISVFHEVLLKWAEGFIEENTKEIPFLEFFTKNFSNEYSKEILYSSMKKFCDYDKLLTISSQKFEISYAKLCNFLAEEILLAKENYFLNEFNEILEKMIALYIPNFISKDFSKENLNSLKKKSFENLAILLDSNNYSSTLAQDQRILIQFVNKYTLSFDFVERMTELFNIKKKFFYEELILWMGPTMIEGVKVSENVLKNTRVIYEKISKNNLAYFKKTYPEYVGNIVEDKNNVSNLTVKFYVNKF